MKTCVIIPVYNHSEAIVHVVEALKPFGLSCYPLAAVDKLLKSVQMGQRMDFDIEVVERLYWQGVDVVNIDTEVQYPLDGISHFQMVQDNLLISRKHAQLFFGMLWRLPRLLLRHWR